MCDAGIAQCNRYGQDAFYFQQEMSLAKKREEERVSFVNGGKALVEPGRITLVDKICSLRLYKEYPALMTRYKELKAKSYDKLKDYQEKVKECHLKGGFSFGGSKVDGYFGSPAAVFPDTKIEEEDELNALILEKNQHHQSMFQEYNGKTMAELEEILKLYN